MGVQVVGVLAVQVRDHVHQAVKVQAVKVQQRRASRRGRGARQQKPQRAERQEHEQQDQRPQGAPNVQPHGQRREKLAVP